MVGLPHALAPAVLHLVTDVLEALERGTGARNQLCADAAVLFECRAVGHAWLDASASAWSVCLWRDGQEGARSLTLSQREDVGDDAERRWPVSTCRRLTLDWLVMPFLAELPLSRSRVRYTVLLLGRERPFGLDDTRRADSALVHLSVVERLVLRLEPPVLTSPDLALSAREREVLRLLAEGLLARSIAQRLDVSERTVHKHLGSVYRKLGVHDRLLAVARGRELGLLPGRPATLPGVEGW